MFLGYEWEHRPYFLKGWRLPACVCFHSMGFRILDFTFCTLKKHPASRRAAGVVPMAAVRGRSEACCGGPSVLSAAVCAPSPWPHYTSMRHCRLLCSPCTHFLFCPHNVPGGRTSLARDPAQQAEPLVSPCGLGLLPLGCWPARLCPHRHWYF